jgi:hypothetical protein
VLGRKPLKLHFQVDTASLVLWLYAFFLVCKHTDKSLPPQHQPLQATPEKRKNQEKNSTLRMEINQN